VILGRCGQTLIAYHVTSYTSQSFTLTIELFSDYFRSKVAKIRQSTAGAPKPVIGQNSTKAFDVFDPVTVDDVIKLLRISPSKHCSLDPAPTWLLKRIAVFIASLICSMCNASVQSGSLPVTQKQTIVYPRLKKQTLDADDPCSFRPISNLSFISNLVERVVTSRFVLHSENNQLFPASQSAYRQIHSTETAVCIVHTDLVRSIDRGHVTVLLMLDLSAAFDTVEHEVLLEILTHRFSVGGVALEWFNSHLSDRTPTICFADSQSKPYNLVCPVPQGSVLGTVEYVAYTEDIVDIPRQHGLNNNMQTIYSFMLK